MTPAVTPPVTACCATSPRSCSSRCASADVIARLGGDEFGILALHCTLEQATRIAEQIRAAMHEYRFFWEQNSACIGASIGVVAITRETATASPAS